MTYAVDYSSGDISHKLTTGTRHFEQALRVDRPPSALIFTTPSALPATQGQALGGIKAWRGCMTLLCDEQVFIRMPAQGAYVGLYQSSLRGGPVTFSQ